MINERSIRGGTRRLSAERIITRILNSAKTPKLQFQLQNDTMVSRATLTRYLSILLEHGLIEEITHEGKTRLRTTQKGLEYLKSKKPGSPQGKEK